MSLPTGRFCMNKLGGTKPLSKLVHARYLRECIKVGNKTTLLKSKPGYNEYCQSTSYDALDESV